jgi:hypothetical protein
MPWTHTLVLAIGLAGGPELDLQWEAPEGCPAGDDVAARVEVLLGRTLDADTRDPVAVKGVIRRESQARFVLTVAIRTAAGERERTFSGQTCEVLADTAALVVAAAIEEPVPEPEPEPKPVEPSPEQTRPPAGPPPSPPTPKPDDRIVAGAARAGVAGLLGPLPGATLGVEAAAALLVRRARVELRFAYWFPRDAEADLEGRGGEIQLWTLGARGCWAPSVKIVEFPLCGGVQAGPMQGDGFGLGAPTSTRLAWVAFDAGAAIVILPWHFFGFWLGADLLVPATRPGFAIEDLGLLHRAAPVGGQAVLGIEGRFGRG